MAGFHLGRKFMADMPGIRFDESQYFFRVPLAAGFSKYG
jgi:hypothetical protein